ncbi:predicted protein [Sclerotinia sclerotiorum 1980 UF-70]|uniref:Uncharacterized protein n=1 Tax=Sclerotinia sclerotiorum (strain ATCC 18683 / 1980 / Ss-1) TaxID=665079 RepID=A7EBM0_SCLS1|nr:predicted protein [Sclerotinia sclerotiorum 1980 UF-70]EDN99848.1 predicted protein [Sclerotinia sclerotiorum 1980 UF-70]
MCLTIKYIYTCGHADYHPIEPCSPTSSPLNCLDQESQVLDMPRMCDRCLAKRGSSAADMRLQDGVRRRMRGVDREGRVREMGRERRGGSGRSGMERRRHGRAKEVGCCVVM